VIKAISTFIIKRLKFAKYFAALLIVSSCGGGSSANNIPQIDDISISINISGLLSPSLSYQKQEVEINSDNLECTFTISLNNNELNDVNHVSTLDNKKFSFKNPIIYEDSEDFKLKVSTITSSSCPESNKLFDLKINKYPLQYSLLPDNSEKLRTEFFQVNDIGFGGIIITDTFSATICYPTPNDCESVENALFGQDAHNIVQGDFNGDGYEDIAVIWALFPHTIESSQKVNAPINIYLNNGSGRFEESLDIYQSGSPPRHPFAYRTVAADFNNDGIDDIFSSSMGIQYRSQDYSENYINPYPHLLLLSNTEGKFEDKSNQIEDMNNGMGQLCNFAHDASAGDPDYDGDTDIFACNILNINDGEGNFTMHEYINLDWQRQNQYGNPMSSLLADLNNDFYDDLIFWNFDNRSSWSNADEGYILLSNNSKDIESWERVSLPIGPFGFDKNKYNHAAYGDLNNDGYVDVVVSITRDLPYYEGAYIQILINNGFGKLIDETESRFALQPRSERHHGEGNLYLRDMNLDGNLDIIHSTRDYDSGFHGAHIAINDGFGNFTSLENSDLPDKPDSGFNNYDLLMKSLPINIDNEGCLDFISVTDAGWENSDKETSNYLFTVVNINCSF